MPSRPGFRVYYGLSWLLPILQVVADSSDNRSMLDAEKLVECHSLRCGDYGVFGVVWLGYGHLGFG